MGLCASKAGNVKGPSNSKTLSDAQLQTSLTASDLREYTRHKDQLAGPASTPSKSREDREGITVHRPLPEPSTPLATVDKSRKEGLYDPFDKAELIRTPAGPLESSPSKASSYSELSSPDAFSQNKTVSSLFDRAAGLDESNDFDIPAVRTHHQHSSPYKPYSPGSDYAADLPISKLRARQAGLVTR